MAEERAAHVESQLKLYVVRETEIYCLNFDMRCEFVLQFFSLALADVSGVLAMSLKNIRCLRKSNG